MIAHPATVSRPKQIRRVHIRPEPRSMFSTFTWLDFAESDRQRAQDVIDLFREQDTRDELGTATIRDAFSDHFFPGTSAIQSRARYFLLIPWMYLRLEEKKTESAEVAQKARREELNLIEVLLESDDHQGTIGRRARRTLKRLPSSVYWQGLQRLGILLFHGSRDQYHRSLDGYYRRRQSPTLRNDDGEVMGAARLRNWHPGLPDAPDGFPRECSLALTRGEAEYLQERILRAAPHSLLARLVENGEPAPDTDFPWEMPEREELPERVRRDLEHAQHFSELMHGASLLYNLWLAELRKDEELAESFSDRVDEWMAARAARAAEHRAWKLEELWEVVARAGGRVPFLTRAFVTQWIALVRDNFGGDLKRHAGARALIHERERQLKRSLARLDGGRALELWGGESGAGQLDYRWNSIVRQLIDDIHDGLER
jgi:hypothetical protein